ncbi:MAG TPA: ATP-binding cassette domain-containing protein, partial [Armatimonadota bacterium]|nr:ATP-binding cassette domain-containing protein [Armatimonadota bacterium]
LARKPDIEDRPGAIPLRRAPRRITVEGLSFGYGEEEVLRDVDLEIRAGEVIGIVGPSGAGKSTLMSLMVRFYDPTAGRICLDGTDLRDVRLASLYENVAAVLQTPFVFNATVRENIRYGRMTASDEEVEVAARDANLHEEILALPQGYETRLGLGGQDLSGGQRQRLNIARALLRNAPILLLDEATSSLDSVSEVRVQEAIERLMRGRTVIAIAHRLSTLRRADRIVVLREGRVEAAAPHEELLRRSPTYRTLCEHQFLALGPEFETVGARG